MVEDNLVELIKQGNVKALEKVYVTNKDSFMFFARKYNISNDDIIDVYQDAILALRDNAIRGKIDGRGELRTYLFGIGKYMIYDILKKRKRLHLVDDNMFFDKETYSKPLFKEELNTQDKKVKKAFENLGDKCKEVLTLFYYRGFTLDEIVEHSNYNSKDVVKSQKSRCLKQLREYISKI
ncbi:MAG: sigma-70 family RNA polymerase sigma factor [Flavobacteriaceae bacterium]|nr:sigma-70 family RNA polymerase sigma factor [Flavobacteriaceae bacterium]